MGTTFVILTTLKLAAMGGVGLSLTTAFQYFHSFDWKPNKKKGEVTDAGESLREKAKTIN